MKKEYSFTLSIPIPLLIAVIAVVAIAAIAFH